MERLFSPAAWVLALLAFGIGLLVYRGYTSGTRKVSRASVVVPTLSSSATEGRSLFYANCATCHGQQGAGTDQGPPLIHDIYNPGHHADISFHRAVRYGVRQHHWPFGDMPSQAHVTTKQVNAIVRYIRELQTANGITYRPHRM